MAANPLSVNSANQFIGSKISLISKADIRYEGVLYSLDLREATISLAKVRSFGTEDRPTERPIPMKDEIYEFIIFRGADIKSIDVLEPPKSNSTMSCGLPQDPAIIEVSSHFRSSNNSNMGGCGMDHHHSNNMRGYNGGRGGEGVFDGLLRGAGGRGGGRGEGRMGRRNNSSGRNNNNGFRGQGEGRRSRQDGGYNNGNNRNNRGNSGSRAQGRGSPNKNGRGQGQGQGGGRSVERIQRTRGIIAPQQPPKVTFQDPFDFEKSNEELKTAMEKLKMNEGEGGAEGSPTKDSEAKDNVGLNKEDMIYYDKDKFFDNISCEALERTKGRNARPDWRAERKLNAETFGLTWNPQGQGQGGQGRGGRQGSNYGGYRSYRYGGNGNYGQMRYNNRYNNRSFSRPQQMRS